MLLERLIFLQELAALVAALPVGTEVQVKTAAQLNAIFANPGSQWSRGLGPRVKWNQAPRLSGAGQRVQVTVCDTSDGTVQVQLYSGKKSWFTPGISAVCILA